MRELEEQRARSQPVVSLVDNMVKLGSLYRGPQEAPLSHRIRNLPSKKGDQGPAAAAAAAAAAAQQMPPGQKNPILEAEAEAEMQQRKADIQVRREDLDAFSSAKREAAAAALLHTLTAEGPLCWQNEKVPSRRRLRKWNPAADAGGKKKVSLFF